MKIKTVMAGDNVVSEVLSKNILIRNTQDALDLYGTVYSDFIILYEHNFEKDFFDLSTRKLGDVLQKFTNFRTKVAVIGNFDKYNSKTLKDFIYESNKHGDYLFVSSISEVIRKWKN
jgi:hypothetical protein